MILFYTDRRIAELRAQIAALTKDNARLKSKLKDQRAEERAARKGPPK